MKKTLVSVVLAIAVAFLLAVGACVGKLAAEDDQHFEFKAGTLVLSRSVYVGNAATVSVG